MKRAAQTNPRPNGLRLVVADSVYADMPHLCGVTRLFATPPECPNCRRPFFTVFSLDTADPLVSMAIGGWAFRYLEVFVCPACAFYMEPYWAAFSQTGVSFTGGLLDGGEVIQEIDTPYITRSIRIEPLVGADYPTSRNRISALNRRQIPPGIYHQIGGLPIREKPVLTCPVCLSAQRFLGIVDYDDQNVPLYENGGQPVALIIGDRDQLNLYLCATCSVIGYQWAT
jgi:hypothetical protein